MSFHNYLLLKKIKVESFNGFSSDITYGFPAVTAFLGFSHMLERKLNVKYPDLKCLNTGIISHKVNIYTTTIKTDKYHKIYFNHMLHPLKKKGLQFIGASLTPEIIGNMECSLIIDLGQYIISEKNKTEFLTQVQNIVHTSRLAGGNISNMELADIISFSSDSSQNKSQWRKIKASLSNGFALIPRQDLMTTDNTFDNFMEKLAINKKTDNRNQPGWIVPITVGYKALTSPSYVKYQRDIDKEHIFVESILSLGEFKMLRHFTSPKDFMWQYAINNKFYLCKGVNLQ